jgi:hypothetical protein
MLAYMLAKTLAVVWRDVDLSVEEGLRELAELCVTIVTMPNGARLHEIPRPRQSSAELLAAAAVTLPPILLPKKAKAGCARNPRGQKSEVRGQSKPLHMIAACDHLGCVRV